MLSDQLVRLKVLRSDRAKFIQWCELANKVLSDEKKLTMEKLKDLAEKSRCFPAGKTCRVVSEFTLSFVLNFYCSMAVSDLIHKVRGLSVKVATWVDEARKLYTSGEKLSMQDAKSLLEAGEKLKVNTQELRTLRASLRAARIWSNKVKRCNLDHGEIHVSTVNDLIEEHESFFIEMPDELSILEQTTQAYCICRRPYEGFMIGCDDCEEWYHGSCIGVSESRADRYEKYSCVRCSTKNVFKSSASGAIEIIKRKHDKWSIKSTSARCGRRPKMWKSFEQS
jgi:antitoxin component HigA of HigAB toxin-antitoxin module